MSKLKLLYTGCRGVRRVNTSNRIWARTTSAVLTYPARCSVSKSTVLGPRGPLPNRLPCRFGVERRCAGDGSGDGDGVSVSGEVGGGRSPVTLVCSLAGDCLAAGPPGPAVSLSLSLSTSTSAIDGTSTAETGPGAAAGTVTVSARVSATASAFMASISDITRCSISSRSAEDLGDSGEAGGASARVVDPHVSCSEIATTSAPPPPTHYLAARLIG